MEALCLHDVVRTNDPSSRKKGKLGHAAWVTSPRRRAMNTVSEEGTCLKGTI